MIVFPSALNFKLVHSQSFSFGSWKVEKGPWRRETFFRNTDSFTQLPYQMTASRTAWSFPRWYQHRRSDPSDRRVSLFSLLECRHSPTSGSKLATGRPFRCIRPFERGERERGGRWINREKEILTAQLADFRSHNRTVLSIEPDKKMSSTGDIDKVITLANTSISANETSAMRTHLRIWPGKYRMYLLSCKERKRMVSKYQTSL